MSEMYMKRTIFSHAFATCLPIFFFFKMGTTLHCPFNPPLSTSHIFIMAPTFYFTEWAEAVPLKNT